MDLVNIRKNDPVFQSDTCSSTPEISPMDPPDAYSPPAKEAIDLAAMHPYLQEMIQEHEPLQAELSTFETTLDQVRQEGISPQTNRALGQFFKFFDDKVMPHNRREERELFPLLNQRLIVNGESSNNLVADHDPLARPTTAIDVMEDNHIAAMQQAAIAFSFFGLASRLPDINSRMLVLDAAIEQGKALVELMRLHIFREDNVVLPLAHKYISFKEFDTIVAQAAKNGVGG